MTEASKMSPGDFMFGQRRTAIESFFGGGFLFGFAILASIIAAIGQSRAGDATLILLLSCVGAGFVIYAKWPSVKRREWTSFGPKDMDKRGRRYYFIGYFILILGCVLSLLFRFAPSLH